MNQNQQPQPWWKRWMGNWSVPALVTLAVAVILAITVLGYWQRRSWTGFVVIEDKDPASPMRVEVVNDPKLLWDWMGLLIVPIVLGAGALWFNQQARKGEQQQRQNELNIADQNRREDALQHYLDRMQELILDKGLKRSKKDAEIRDVARVRTLAALRSLDSSRKGQVARFLHEADLIGKVVIEESGERQVIEAIIDLGNADLEGANLISARLEGANLISARLEGANLISANLISANLTRANLSGASLLEANLGGANLGGANLRGAKGWTNEQLAQAASLVGATLPKGTVMTEEAWEEFKKRYGQ